MKKFYILGSLLITISAVSQINSPNGNNIFSYNGLADVTFSFPDRGSGGRAFVHYPNNILSLNYNEDFTGGTLIGKNVFFKDNGNSFISSGNFGIGTTNPLAKLEVSNGNLLVRNIVNTNEISSIMIAHSVNVNSLDDTGTSIRTITQNSGGNNYAMQFFTEDSYLTGQTEKVRILGNGNVGIGTFNPTQKLEVSGSALFQGMISSSISDDGGGKIQLQNPSKNSNGIASTWAIYNMTGVYGNSLQFWAYDNLGCGAGLCNNRFTIMDNGNVGIGATNPANKLDVNGTIHSQEVKVDMTGWSDFVFKKEYNLPTLEEVEKHIAEKGHLENIPNEKEVLENGINLGEMNAKLLLKIEELTLYMIEMKKENTEMKKDILLLKKKLH